MEASQLLSPEELFSGLWLIMAGVDDIPPHIALLNEGKYYSVSARKVDIGSPLENLLKAISRKNVPTLFIKFPQPASQLIDLEGIFEQYPTLGTPIQNSAFNIEHFSCLWPVRDFFANAFGVKYSKATLVFELLKMAQDDNIILGCKSLFVDEPIFANGLVTLPKYTQEQIRERINSILNVNE
jgi:hypothetical protein